MKTLSQHHLDSNGLSYRTFPNDPYGVRQYTLENGLTVILAQHDEAPRIQTYIAVRAGSNQDPADTTGLAHYLEHMMFKGNSRLGTANWELEKPLLDRISDLYEEHKAAGTQEEKQEIYRQIDALSHEASAYAVPSEYDKLLTELGAMNTNAHTWLDETVYKNNIPANELARWLTIEKERFSGIALRLFHTELETVYEEFNRAQDNDGRLVHQELMQHLFPTHPNGQQTTLGRAEHLKNPSMEAIQTYYRTWYVPNNMAVVLVGDLDFEDAIQHVQATFGTLEARELPPLHFPQEKPLEKPVLCRVSSPTVARLQMAWRTDGYGSRTAMLADIVAQLCSNKAEAGLMDTLLNQQQETLFAQAYSTSFKEYGYFSAVIVPRADQTLEEGKAQILAILQKIKEADFPDWMLAAVVQDLRLLRLKSWETANGLATTLYDSFLKNRTWGEDLEEITAYETVTKEEVQAFAAQHLAENYVAVEKVQGENESLLRVENPGITPIQLKRDGESTFAQGLREIKTPEIAPVFVDYDTALEKRDVHGRTLYYVKNKFNELCEFHFIVNVGTDHLPLLSLASQYLQYTGTEKYTAAQIRQEFYRLGFSDEIITSGEETRAVLKGPQSNLPEALQLFYDWLQHAQADEKAYQKFIQTIEESRQAAKQDKNRIFSALKNYAQFGKNSRFRDVVSREKMHQTTPDALLHDMQQLLQYPMEMFYYGPAVEDAERTVLQLVPKDICPAPAAKNYPQPPTGNKVYRIHYDMVQVELAQVARAEVVNPRHFAEINVFNEYFGRGLSSIVFQEVRERRSLAYSAYISYGASPKLQQHDYVQSFLGTQPDKLPLAVQTLNELVQTLPKIDLQFEAARQNALKKIASTRITRAQIYFTWRAVQKLGINHDYRRTVYEDIQNMQWADLANFHQTYLAPLQYNTAIIGAEGATSDKILSAWGEVETLTLEEIFGY